MGAEEAGAELGQRKIRQLRANSNRFREGLVKMGCRVLGDIDAKVICSLRRSSLDRALSKAVQVVFHASCGVSNAVLKSERECLDALKRRGVALQRADIPMQQSQDYPTAAQVDLVAPELPEPDAK